MSALSIQPTYPIFTDIDGQPLEAGYVWIGTANLDPQTNPINVYWDAALTIAAPQPIRTLAGYPSRNGTPARLYVNSDYSIRVMNRNGSTVYSAPSATERYNEVVIGGVNADDVNYVPAGSNAQPTDVQDKLRQISVSISDYVGADPTGVSTSSAALQAANDYLAGVGGGQIQIPDGVFLFSTAVALDSNITIVGNGPTSILKGGVSSFITATGKSNIEIRNVKFLNDNYRVFFDTCTNVRLMDCYGDGTRASTNVTNQGFWFRACDEVLIENPYFVDYRDAIYFDKNGATPCGTATVRGGQIWQTKHGSLINFPTGVYGVDIKKLYVDGTIFKNIKASSDSTGTGTGYGVYEGDGTDGNLEIVKVTNCKFIDDDGYTTRPMIGVLISVAQVGMVDSCYFKGPAGGSYVGFIYGSREQTIQNCVFDAAACQPDRITGTPKMYLVANNMFKNVTNRVLRVSPNTPAVENVTVIGNTFRDCTNGPITMINVTYPQIIGNTIYDCNTSGLTTDSYRAGINFDGPTRGLIANNTVLNISTGQCQYGFNVANATNQVVVAPSNYFKGMTVAQTRNALAAPPTVGDWGIGDSIWNWSAAAGGTPGWVCTTAGTPGTWKAMANLAV